MSVMYIYDEHLKVIDISDTNAMETAKIDMSINEGSTLDITSTFKFPDQMRYVALRDPISQRRNTDEEEFLMYHISSSAIEEDDLFSYTFTEFAYDELAFDGYIVEERPNQSTFNDGLDLILKGTKWKRGLTNIEGKEDLDFFYLTPIEAISELNKKFPAEFRFWLRLKDDGTIEERIVDAVKQRGQNTGKRFETTSNLISLVAEDDFTNVYSAIVPRGKGEEIDADGDPNTRPGYGRKIGIKDVEWSKAKGDPLNKPRGQEWLALENGETLVDGRLRYKIVNFDDDTDPNVLINHAYTQLLKDSVVKRQFTANALDLGVSELGDTVQLVDKERHMEYQARIFRVVYDMVEPSNSEVEFGDNIRSESSISNVISDVAVKQDKIVNDTNWAIQRADGKNTTYLDENEPANPRKGDVWYKILPNGNTEEYYFNGTDWVLGAKTDQQWQENIAIAQGSHTTFYGIATPVGAVKGDVWFKNDNNVPDGEEMYTYSGTTWIKFNGAHDANRLTAGEINGKLLQITNVNTNNLVGEIDGKLNKLKNVDTTALIGEIDGKLNKLKNVDTSALVGGLDGTKNPLSNVPANQLTGTMNKEVVNTIELNAAQITSGKLNSNIVNAIELNASQITAGKLNANVVGAIELNAQQITSGKLNSKIVNTMELNAQQITSGELNSNIVNAMELNAAQITSGQLNSKIVNAIELNASQIVAGQIDASKINVFNLNADNIKTGTIDGSKINVMNLNASNIVTGNLSANFLKGGQIDASQINVINLNANNIVAGTIDVTRISGEVADFIRAYWDGEYGSTSITSEGMTVSAGLATTVFDKDGMKFDKSNRSVGRIGVNELYQDFSKKGLYFGLESTGDFMAWGAQNYAGNPYSTKLSWFRTGAVPSNLPGLIEGFNFEDNVSFRNPIEIRGGIKMQGTNDNLLVRASNLNGGSYPTFGGPSAYFVYAGSDIYLSSNGTAINLTKIAKAFGGIRTAAIPTGFNSNGTATGWYNVDMS